MANTIDWGKASVNNTNGYGKGAIDNTIRWGKIYESSASGDTNIGTATTPSFSNTKSVRFDGVDDSVEIGNPVNLQLTGAMTLSMWFKGQPSQSGAYAGIDKLGGGGQRGAGLDLRNGTGIYLFIASGSSTNLLVSTNTTDTTPLTDGNWHHVMGVYIPSTSLKIYLDGVEVASKTNSIPSTQHNSGTTPWSIGKRSAHSNFMNGGIDEVSIFSTALNVSDLYDGSGIPTDLTNLSPLGWWRMGDSDTFPILTDNGSGGNDGTMTNMTSGNIVTDVPT